MFNMIGGHVFIDGEDMSAGARLMRYYIQGGDDETDVSPATALKLRTSTQATPENTSKGMKSESIASKRRRRLNPPAPSPAPKPTPTPSPTVLTEHISQKLVETPVSVPTSSIGDMTASPPLPNTQRRTQFEREDEPHLRGDLNNLRHDVLYHLATRHSHQQIMTLVAKYHPDANFGSRDLTWRMGSIMKVRARQSHRHRREIKAELDALRRENGVSYADGKSPEEVSIEVVDDKVFEEDPSLLKADKLIELCTRYTHSQILANVKAHYPDLYLSGAHLTERLEDAILVKSKRENKSYAQVRAELNTLRDQNGTVYAHQNGTYTNERAALSYKSVTPSEGTTSTTDNADAGETTTTAQTPDDQGDAEVETAMYTAILDKHPNFLRGRALIDLAARMSYPDILSRIKSNYPDCKFDTSNLSSRLQSALKSQALHEHKTYEEVRQALSDTQKANNLKNARKLYKQREPKSKSE